jgi:ribosomal protein S27E
MSCAPDAATAFYRPRQIWQSPLYQLVEKHYDEFERVYPERFAQRYGFWRPVIGKAVGAYLSCGDLRQGFARVRCPDCGHDLFVPFSCKQRCVCPSCHQKRTLVTAINVAEHIAAPVPHRQFVFTMPKRLRLYFRYHRDLLRELPKLAWTVTLQVYHAVLGRDDVVPGMVAAIQTHGQLLQWHPHLHCLTTWGAFTPEGAFLPLPDDLATEPFLKLWEAEVFKLLLDEGRITEQTVAEMRSWRHSGFSVDKSVHLDADDTAAVERLIQYMVRCPFSIDRIVSSMPDGKVVMRAEKAACQPFPVLGDARLAKGIPRNFEVFDPLDFLAELTQHIPDPSMQMVRYYGYYSNRARGDRRRAGIASSAAVKIEDPRADEEDTPYRKLCRMRWSALIKRVYETSPLTCPNCGGTMAIVSFIEQRNQAEVIERILKHCGLWDRPGSRAPPAKNTPLRQPLLELEYVSVDEFPMAL